MNFPPKTYSKIISRFDVLISKGLEIHASPEYVAASYAHDDFGGSYEMSGAYKKVKDWQVFVQWKANVVTLLCYILPEGHVHRGTSENFMKIVNGYDEMEWALGFIRGIMNDLESGFLDDLYRKIENEMAADYLGQAESLLKEGRSGKWDHIPAAVLCGSILEKSLRKLCDEQNPPVSRTSASGAPKTMNPIIDDLKNSGLFSELKAKQLRAWADIRNKAAHGDFDQFSRTDVEQMLNGVSSFLAEVL